MVALSFLQQENFKAIAENAGYPAALLDADFNILWCNEPAQNSYPFGGSAARFPFIDKAALLDRLRFYEAVSIRVEPFPESGGSAVFRLLEDGTICVFVCTDGVMVHSTPNLLDGVDAFSNYVRSNVQSAFISTAVIKGAENDDPAQNEHVNQLERTSYKMLRMANNMSLLARYLSGSYRASRRLFDVAGALREMCEAARNVVSAKIPLRYDIPDDSCVLEIDSELFTTAFINLLANAYLFTRDGNEIEVRLAALKNSVTITVADRGIGIRKEILPKVTEPYFSSDPYGEGERPGIGLGLSVAALAAQQHGGTLLINSEFGAGTAVALTLARTRDLAEAPQLLYSGAARYVTDRFSDIYVGLCEVCEIP